MSCIFIRKFAVHFNDSSVLIFFLSNFYSKVTHVNILLFLFQTPMQRTARQSSYCGTACRTRSLNTSACEAPTTTVAWEISCSVCPFSCSRSYSPRNTGLTWRRAAVFLCINYCQKCLSMQWAPNRRGLLGIAVLTVFLVSHKTILCDYTKTEVAMCNIVVNCNCVKVNQM